MTVTTPHFEVQGWPKELYVLKGSAYERKIRCAWNDRYALASELDTYPDSIFPYNTASGAILDTIKMEPERNSKSSDAGNGKISYENAILTCNYSTLGPSTANLVSERLTPGVSGVKLAGDRLYWDTAGEKPVGTGSRLIPVATYTLRYHRAAAVPAAALTLPGYVNNNTVETKILGVSFSANFLLYRGAVVRRVLSAAGITLFDATHVCSYAYNDGFGWNRLWRPETGTFGLVYDSDGNLKAPYPTTAFSL